MCMKVCNLIVAMGRVGSGRVHELVGRVGLSHLKVTHVQLWTLNTKLSCSKQSQNLQNDVSLIRFSGKKAILHMHVSHEEKFTE